MKQNILFLLLFLLPLLSFAQGTPKDTVKVIPFDSLQFVDWSTLDTSDQILFYDSSLKKFNKRISFGELLKKVQDISNVISTGNIVNNSILPEDVDTSALGLATRYYVDSLKSAAPGLDSLIQAGRTFTFHAGDSAYSMRSVDTFFLEGGQYHIVVGNDTLIADLEIDLGAVCYFDKLTGNDTTGQRGNPSLPFRTPWKAYEVAQDGDLLQGLSIDTFIIDVFADSTYVNGLVVTADTSDSDYYTSDISWTINKKTSWNFQSGSQIQFYGDSKIASDAELVISIEISDGTYWGMSNVSYEYNFIGDATAWEVESIMDFYGNERSIWNIESFGGTVNSSEIPTFLQAYDSHRLDLVVERLKGGLQYSDQSLSAVSTINISAQNNSTELSRFSYQLSNVDSVYRKVIINAVPYSTNISSVSNSVFETQAITEFYNHKSDNLENIDLIFDIRKADFKIPQPPSHFFDRFHVFKFTRSDSVNTNIKFVGNSEYPGLILAQDLGESQGFSTYRISDAYFNFVPTDVVIDENISVFDFSSISNSENKLFVKNSYLDNTSMNQSYVGAFFNQPDSVESEIYSSTFISIDSTLYENLEDTSYLVNSHFNYLGPSTTIESVLGVVEDELTTNLLISNFTANVEPINSDDAEYISFLSNPAAEDKIRHSDVTLNGGNAHDFRITDADQIVFDSENSQAMNSDSGNVSITAPYGNITLNGGASGEIKLQGDSLDAPINYVSDYDDGINNVIVENSNGELRATTRLLPKWDTLIVTTANDTIDLARHLDQVAFLDMTSAPSTVTLVVENPANLGWLHMIFLNVGGTHTINFSHSTADADAASSFDVTTTSNQNGWVFRYVFGSWIANYMSP